MSSDEVVRQLARAAREEAAAAEAEDPRWERLARGELTAAEEDGIRRQAADDPEIAAMYQAFRPLGEATKSRIVDGIVGGDAKANIVPVRRWRRAAMVAIPLAAAAAVASWIARPSGDEREVAASSALVPDYVLAVTGGDRPTRSGGSPEPGPLVLQRDSLLELVLRPSTLVTGKVVARGFLVQGTDARAWSPSMEVSSDGAIRMAGRAGELLAVPSGAWDVVLTVGRAGALPSDPQLVARAMTDPAAPRPWRLFVTRVQLVDAR